MQVRNNAGGLWNHDLFYMYNLAPFGSLASTMPHACTLMLLWEKGVEAPRFALHHPIPLVLRSGSLFSGWGAYQAS
jgi:hypothetical protein